MQRFQDGIRIGLLAFVIAATAGQIAARADEMKSGYFGRWTVDDPTDKFSPNGKLYRVFDIAPCGKDFCGVSVDGGVCGATLFRFLAIHANADSLEGHAKWGDAKKKILIAAPSPTQLSVQMGDLNIDFSSRNSMPTFTSEYHRVGDASCTANDPAM